VICQLGIVKGTSVTRLDMRKNKVFNYGVKPTEMVVQGETCSYIPKDNLIRWLGTVEEEVSR
jgi:hypothetical protein